MKFSILSNNTILADFDFFIDCITLHNPATAEKFDGHMLDQPNDKMPF